ncbi:MAG: hypothetical protein OSB82_17735 [Alphaproteobacteria bacterium]|nr:hypothetical protein [Alphaproteobacteria bacterium]
MPLEVTRSIHGAWRIARMDPDALNYFELSIDGFWRSFVALLVVAPFYIMFLILNHGSQPGLELPTGPVVSTEFYVAVKLIAYIIGWLIFPLVMVPISRLLDLSQSYIPYIIVWNWSNVLVMAVILPTLLLFPPADQTGAAAKMVLMGAQITMLFYGFLVARAGLRCKILTAVGIVVLDLLLSLMLSLMAGRLL